MEENSQELNEEDEISGATELISFISRHQDELFESTQGSSQEVNEKDDIELLRSIVRYLFKSSNRLLQIMLENNQELNEKDDIADDIELLSRIRTNSVKFSNRMLQRTQENDKELVEEGEATNGIQENNQELKEKDQRSDDMELLDSTRVYVFKSPYFSLELSAGTPGSYEKLIQEIEQFRASKGGQGNSQELNENDEICDPDQPHRLIVGFLLLIGGHLESIQEQRELNEKYEISVSKDLYFEIFRCLILVWGILEKNTQENNKELVEQGEATNGIQEIDQEVHQQDEVSDDLDVLTTALLGYFLNKKSCDVTILIGDRCFEAHRLILGIRSPILAAKFKNTMKQKNINYHVDCDPDAFYKFLLYLYSSKLEDISIDLVVKLFGIATEYEVSPLIKTCATYMINNISVDAFCDIFLVAQTHGEIELLQALKDFFVTNMESIIITKTWKSFLNEHANLVNDLLLHISKRIQLYL